MRRVHLPLDRNTGRLKGFGFVEISSDTEEDTAIAALDGVESMGHSLKANKAKAREEKPRSGGDDYPIGRTAAHRNGGNRGNRS